MTSNGHVISNGHSSFSDTHKFLRKILQLLENKGVFVSENDNSTVKFQQPDVLKTLIDLELTEDGIQNEEKLMKICQIIIEYSVKTGNSLFINQLYGGMDKFGLAGTILTEALNTSQYTYEVAPSFTLCEEEVLRRFSLKIGFSNSDGIFCPGGSISNMYGIALARYKRFPEIKQTGMFKLPKLVIFTSQDAHYSIIKAANWLGIGTDNVIKVETNKNGCMIPESLMESIENIINDVDKVPLFVNATAGTTVLGAFDPLDEIASICEKYKIWLHVDACWGGSLIFSNTHSYLLKGLHRANSVSWNSHKMLGAPLQCAMFLVNEKNLLHNCNCAGATYLFQQDKMYDVRYDTGDKSIQCGRKVDAFKLWMMWKIRGDTGFGLLVDRAMFISRYFLKIITQRPGFKLVIPEIQCTNVTFWYIPLRFRNLEETEQWWNEIDKIAPKLKKNLVSSGQIMIGYQPLAHKGLKNFFRLVTTCHPESQIKDMHYIVEQIEKFGLNL